MKRIVLLAVCLLSACSKKDPCEYLAKRYDTLPLLKPLPKQGLYELRVLYLEDKRMPSLDAADRAALYSRVEALTKRWLGYTIKLREVGARDLAAEFARPDISFRKREEDACIVSAALDIESKSGMSALENLVEREYKLRGAAVFTRLFPGTADESEADARKAAVDTFLSRHRWLAGLSTPEGQLLAAPVHRRMYSYLYWASIVRNTKEADFYLTNAGLAEPDNDMPIYVLARGGLTTGFVDSNLNAPLGASGLITLLPFLSGERMFDATAKQTGTEENLDAAATMWLHELGHFLNRYGEMYGESGCVHVASENLQYFKWHRAIRKADNRCSKKPAFIAKY